MVTRTPDRAAADAILEAMPGLVLVVDASSCVEYANAAVTLLTGASAANLVGGAWSVLCARADDGPVLRQLEQHALQGGAAGRHVASLVTASGDLRQIDWGIRPCPASADGRPRTLWMGRDITDERRAAQARRRAEDLLASVGDNMFDAQLLLSVERDGAYRIRAANRRYLEVLRARGIHLSEQALIGKTREELAVEVGVSPESRDQARARYEEVVRTRQAVRYETSFPVGDGVAYVETSVAPIVDEQGVCTHIVRTTRDLTERVQAERALRVSEARLREAETVGRIGCFDTSLPARSVAWSEETFRILELDPAVDIPSYERFLDVVHPDDRALIRQSYEASVADRLPYHVVHRLQLPDGRIKWIDARCVTEHAADGAPLRSIGTLQDITERVMTERALGETRTAYRQLDAVSRLKDRAIEASINAIVFTDLDGTIGYVNRSFLRMWGFTSDREVTGRPAWQCFADRVHAAAALQRLRVTGDWVGELVARRLDGTLFTVLMSVTTIRDDRGDAVQLMASVVDVTARARVEDALRRSEQRYRHLFEQALDGILLADGDAQLIDVNACACELTGYTRAELLRMRLQDLVAPDQALPDFPTLPPGSQDAGEFRWVHKDGRPLHVDLRARKLSDGTLLAIVRDVTERRQVEAEARRVRDLLRVVIDSSPDGIFLKDQDHRFLLVNEAFAAIAGVKPEAMIGRRDSDFWDLSVVEGDPAQPARGFRSGDRLALAGDVVRSDHVPLRHADGTLRVFSTVKRPLFDLGSRVYGVLGYTRDVTEQCESDRRQRRSLHEKEILLREIHHRVKNNLQIISSLLHFQAKNVRSPEDRAAFEDGRKRLLAMILVHDRLYQSDDLTSVEFGMYARALVAALAAMFEQNGRVRVTMTTDDLRLPAELALPSGLILCELVTNVFKYAYPGDMCGTAFVDTVRTDDRVLLRVRDSGIGFPADFDPRAARTFGWHLITTLAQQLRATVETTTAGGACVRIAYPLPGKTETPWNRSRRLPH